MAASLDAVLAGHCEADRRPLLQARLASPDGLERTRFALNDVVFNRLATGRMLMFETRIDDRYVNSHGGDGMVVATATGSTAYALSCGGPIVDPRLEVLVVAPICPHTLSDRPILVPGSSRIDIQLTGPDDVSAQVTCDAGMLGELKPGGSSRSRLPAAASRCCTRPGSTTSACCARNCTGASAAGATSAEHAALPADSGLRDHRCVELDFSAD